MSAVHLGGDAGVASRVVLAWVRFYTRDIAPDVAETRRAELGSDVWEQVNDPDARPGTRGVFLFWRTARSVPADLAWRFGALRHADTAPRSLFTRWEHGGLSAVLLIEAFVLTGLLAAMILHVLHGGNAGSLGRYLPATVAGLGLGFAAAVVGFWFLLTRRTRCLGSVLTGGASIALVAIGAPAMAQISTTVAAIYYSTSFMGGHPSWSDVLLAAVVLLVLFHTSVALTWVPTPARWDRKPAGQ